MVKVRFVVIGKIKEAFYRDAVKEYEKRLSRFCKTEIFELAERASLKEEAEDILRYLKGHVFVLAIEGKERSSEKLAAQIKTLCDAGKEMTFVIGSSCGLHDSVKEKADDLLSFSPMTFPHQLMRVVLFEQVYRAFMINAGAEYHK